MSTTIHAQWFGGHNYSRVHADVEKYPTIAAAKRVFEDRRANRDRTTPCVDETAEMWLWLGPDDWAPEVLEFDPDVVIRVGPRGGIVVERSAQLTR